MATRRGKKAPARALGRQCRKCGADEWRKGEKYYRCWPCAKRLRRDGLRRKAKADPSSRLWWKAKQRTQESGVDFSITLDDVRTAWPSDNRCPALGIVLRQGKEKIHDASPTLDRINPAWGYVPGNIAVLSYAANRAKGNLSAEQLSCIADWMRASGLA